jgi:hypothetical protein
MKLYLDREFQNNSWQSSRTELLRAQTLAITEKEAGGSLSAWNKVVVRQGEKE